MVCGLREFMPDTGNDFPGVNWLQLVLATPVLVYSGWPFFRGAWQSARVGLLLGFQR